jgi:S-adenosylmethionine hydrolase
VIVTLLTDFGTADYFAGAMKGAVLSVNPAVTLIDITHEIPAHDVEAAAFTLSAAFDSFPAGTVHVAVVDPGVGSARRPIVVEAHGHFFVGPDNGVFGLVCASARGHRAFHLTNEKYFRRGVSATFHGRDVFAPAAGALTLGVGPETMGPAVGDLARLPFTAPRRLDEHTLEAVVHIDHFGNCLTNISRADLPPAVIESGARFSINGREVKALRRFYDEDVGADDEPFVIWGSAGLLEISVNRNSAARLLDACRGQVVRVSTARVETVNDE